MVWGLARRSIIPRRKVVQFIVGIVLISAIGTIMIGYTAGLGEREFFLVDRPNVLVLYDQTSTTPITGVVPRSLQPSLLKIPGVTTVSPEIYGLGFVQSLKAPVFVHGVSPTFFEIVPTTIVEGENPFLDNRSSLNGVLVGKNLASSLGLSSGQQVELVSSLTDATLRFTVAGVFHSGEATDDEFLVPLELARDLSWVLKDFYTLFQLQFDPAVTTKAKVQSFLTTTFATPIFFDARSFLDSLSPSEVRVVVKRGAEVVLSQPLQSFNTTFDLAIGSYVLEVRVDRLSFSQSYTFDVSGPATDPHIFPVGPQAKTLSISVVQDGELTGGFNTRVSNPFDNTTYLTTTAGAETITNARLEAFLHYRVDVWKGNLWDSTELFLENDQNLTLTLDRGFSVTVLNASTDQPILNPSVAVLDSTIDPLSYHIIQKENTVLTLVDENPWDPWTSSGPFEFRTVMLNVSSGEASTHFPLILDLNQPPTNVNLFLGKVDYNLTLASNSPVTGWTVRQTDSQIASGVGVGPVLFTGQARQDYFVQVNTTTTTHTFKVSSNSSLTQVIQLDDLSELHFQLTNGSDPTHPALAGVSLNISSPSFSAQVTTDGEGFAHVTLPHLDLYQVAYSLHNYSRTMEVGYLSSFPVTHNLSLGGVRLQLSTHSLTTFPIEGQPIRVVNLEGTLDLTLHTNTSGFVDVSLPLTNYSVFVEQQGFLRRYDLLVDQPQVLTQAFTLNPTSEVVVSCVDMAGIILQGVEVTLSTVDAPRPFNHHGTTAGNGQTAFLMGWGVYELTAVYKGLVVKEVVTVSSDNSTVVSLEFLINSLAYNEVNTGWGKALRDLNIGDSSGFVDEFLQTTFTAFVVALFIGVLVTIVLSLMSLESIISFPLYQHRKDLRVIKLVGGRDEHIAAALGLRLACYSFGASVVGVGLAQLVLILVEPIGRSNVGGFIFTPLLNIPALGVMLVVIFGVSFLLTVRTTTKYLRNG